MMNVFERLKHINEEIRAGERKLAAKTLSKAQTAQMQERLKALRIVRIDLEAPPVAVDGVAAGLHMQTQEPWRGRKNINGKRASHGNVTGRY